MGGPGSGRKKGGGSKAGGSKVSNLRRASNLSKTTKNRRLRTQLNLIGSKAFIRKGQGK